jgi:hypothetical protein
LGTVGYLSYFLLVPAFYNIFRFFFMLPISFFSQRRKLLQPLESLPGAHVRPPLAAALCSLKPVRYHQRRPGRYHHQRRRPCRYHQRAQHRPGRHYRWRGAQRIRRHGRGGAELRWRRKGGGGPSSRRRAAGDSSPAPGSESVSASARSRRLRSLSRKFW